MARPWPRTPSSCRRTSLTSNLRRVVDRTIWSAISQGERLVVCIGRAEFSGALSSMATRFQGQPHTYRVLSPTTELPDVFAAGPDATGVLMRSRPDPRYAASPVISFFWQRRRVLNTVHTQLAARPSPPPHVDHSLLYRLGRRSPLHCLRYCMFIRVLSAIPAFRQGSQWSGARPCLPTTRAFVPASS